MPGLPARRRLRYGDTLLKYSYRKCNLASPGTAPVKVLMVVVVLIVVGVVVVDEDM